MQLSKQKPKFFRNKLMLTFFLMSLLLVTSAGCDVPIGGSATICGAGPFVVTHTLDLNDDVCDANCTLREAVLAANSCSGPDVIELGIDTYNLVATGSGDERGDLNIHQDLTIVGMGQEASIIESSTFGVFTIDSGVNVTMQDLTIQGGISNGDGGGILNAGNLSLTNVSLLDNAASGDGGGLFSSGTLELTDVIVDGNQASRGGGILNTGEADLSGVQVTSNEALVVFPASERFEILPNEGQFHDCGGGINNQGNMVIADSQVSYNFAYLGGGICNGMGALMEISGSEITWNPSDTGEGLGFFRRIRAGGGIVNYFNLMIIDSNISANKADSGGGIYGLRLEGGTIQLENSDLIVNSAHNGHGGGIHMLGGDLVVLHSRIDTNVASNHGGGVYIQGNFGQNAERMNVTMSHSAIIRNVATGDGGGFYQRGGSSSVLELFNSTISGNRALRGAGIFESSGGGETSLWHVTIADNYALRGGGGGGIFYHLFAGEVTFKSTLIGNNSPGRECEADLPLSLTVISEGYNLVETSGCHIEGGLRDRIIGGTSLGLLPLAEVDGTYVHELFPFSEAVDHVAMEDCPVDDQRGETRPAGPDCDTGAYELNLETMSADVPIIPTPAASSEPTATALTNASCRKGADPAHEVHNFLFEGQTALIVGRLSETTWVYVELPDELGRCWIFSENLDLTGPVDSLPLFTSPALPQSDEGGGDDGAGDGGGGNDGGGNDGGGNDGGGGGGSAPPAPSNASISNRTCDSEDYFFTIVWHDNASNENGFRILRDGVLIATLGANVESYMYTPPGSGPYTFTIEAFNDNGTGNTTVQEAICFV